MISSSEIINKCKEKNIRLSEYTILNEMRINDLTRDEILNKMKNILDIMKDSVNKGLENKMTSIGGLLNGESYKVNKYINSSSSISGDFMTKVMARALSCSEVNASMGRIVAAPTAGSCGILPAVLISVGEKYGLSDDEMVHGLLTASLIGAMIMKDATVAGAEGGCQAECGSASAMASAAIVEMLTKDQEKPFHAAAISLQNILGLVCDPIGELVEVPCANRNATGAVMAIATADLVLSGIKSLVPFDEMIEAMYKVGKSLPEELRETGCGGTAGTKTAQLLKNSIFKK